MPPNFGCSKRCGRVRAARRSTVRGPFAAWMHAPEFGELAQALGAHARYKTALPPRLSEFAILCTARLWRAQYEWFAHAPMAEKAGVKPQTIRDLKAGRAPKSAGKDERAIYDFIKELYRTRRVSERTYKRAHALARATPPWSSLSAFSATTR